MGQYEHGHRCKFLLRYHLIFVCKYRRKILLNQNIVDDLKKLSIDISVKHNVKIIVTETDNDHIHYLIETIPNINYSLLISLADTGRKPRCPVFRQYRS